MNHSKELSTLLTISKNISTQQNFTATASDSLNEVLKLTNSKNIVLFNYDEDRDEFSVLLNDGISFKPGDRYPSNEYFFINYFNTNDPFIITDYPNYSFHLEPLDQANISICILFPLLFEGKLTGIIMVASEAEEVLPIVQSNLNLLVIICSQIGGLLLSHNLHQSLQEKNSALTSLYDAILTVNNSLESKVQLDLLLKIAIDMVHADTGCFYSYDVLRNCFVPEIYQGKQPDSSNILQKMSCLTTKEHNSFDWVLENKLPLSLSDGLNHSECFGLDEIIRSIILLPVLYSHQLLGVMCILSSKEKAFTKNDERWMVQFSNHIAIALQYTHLFQEMENNLIQIKTLHSIERAISSNLDLILSLNLIAESLKSTIKIDAIRILILKRSVQLFEVAQEFGCYSKSSSQKSSERIIERFTSSIINERESVYFGDLQNVINLPQEYIWTLHENLHTYYALPLIASGKVKGVIEIFSKTPNFNFQEYFNFIDAVTLLAATAIEQAEQSTEIYQKNSDLYIATNSIISGWVKSLEFHNHEEHEDLLNMAQQTELISRILKLEENCLGDIYHGVLLHDMGNISIPENILHKTDSLTPEEWKIIKDHPLVGKELLTPIDFLHGALDIVYCHHERWNGSGYPRGLQGQEIPISARIFAVVDVWNSLRSERPYRQSWTKEKSRNYLINQSGILFDPEVVQAFFRIV